MLCGRPERRVWMSLVFAWVLTNETDLIWASIINTQRLSSAGSSPSSLPVDFAREFGARGAHKAGGPREFDHDRRQL